MKRAVEAEAEALGVLWSFLELGLEKGVGFLLRWVWWGMMMGGLWWKQIHPVNQHHACVCAGAGVEPTAI